MAEDDGKHGNAAWPRESDVGRWTDAYFNRTRTTVQAFGDVEVTYAVFMRRPVVFAPRLMIEWLEAMAAARGTRFRIEPQFQEGQWVGAGEPMLYLTGSFADLVDLETDAWQHERNL